jgi:hypothetical protein
VKLRVVVLELILLEEDNLGRLRDVDSDSGKALGFTDQGQDLRVEVHIEAIVVGMAND